VIYGVNRAKIGDGVIASVTIKLATAAAARNYAVTLANIVATDPSGVVVSMGSTGGPAEVTFPLAGPFPIPLSAIEAWDAPADGNRLLAFEDATLVGPSSQPARVPSDQPRAALHSAKADVGANSTGREFLMPTGQVAAKRPL